MSHLTRRRMSREGGFTLVELLIALVLLGVVTTALYRVLINNQRVYTAQTQRIDLQQNIRAAATILPADLREANATDGDISAATATSITFRAMRWMRFMCNPPVNGGLVQTPSLTLTLTSKRAYGIRGPALGDSVLIYYEGDDGTSKDDTWVPAKITTLATANCPGLPTYPDNTSGQQLVVTAWMPTTAVLPALPAPNLSNSIYAGDAVRGFETVTYQLYQPAGDTSYYVGLQTASGTQPLIGPVLSNGLTLAYFDSTGANLAAPVSAANLIRIARVDITVRARTAQPVRLASGSTLLGAIVDSVVTRVSLRNNRRF
jgi:prepilin-type N-terminal cleavage/methylation domain-containing protein